MAKKAAKTEHKKLYRLLVRRKSPIHYVTVGGQQFCTYSEKVEGYGAETKRDRIAGAEVYLNETQVKFIKDEAKHKFVRVTTGKRQRSRLYDDRSKNFRPNEKDLPLTRFIAIEQITQSQYEEPQVPTLAEEEAAA